MGGSGALEGGCQLKEVRIIQIYHLFFVFFFFANPQYFAA